MKQTLLTQSKWYWPWQDDKEENWLGEMSRQGSHLQHVGAFGQYTFVHGESRAYAYRLDFVTTTKKNPDYYQLFQDAGWEHVGEMGGWQYWRKEIINGNVPEIFTDNASKIQKYQRLIAFLVIYFPIFVVFLSNYSRWSNMAGSRGFFSVLYEILFFVFFILVMVFAFCTIKITQRISSLKKK
jgi:preprotein translocase subunit SecG